MKNLLFWLLTFYVKDKYGLLKLTEDYVYGEGYTDYFHEKFKEIQNGEYPTLNKFQDTPNAVKFNSLKIRYKTTGK